MIEELWSALKASLLAEGGYWRLIEFLEHALATAEVERDKQQERENERMRLQ